MTEESGEGWGYRVKVAAVFAVALVVLVLASIWALRVDPAELELWPLAALAAGVFGFYKGFERLRRRQLIVNTPTSKVRSLAVGDVEVKGQARPVDEPITSPLTHTSACIYELEVQEEHEDDDGSDWVTVVEMREEVPFVVDDGTGKVRVQVSEADLDVERERRVHVDNGDPPPSQLAEWAVEEDHLTPEEVDRAREEGGYLDEVGDFFTGGDSKFEEQFAEPSTHDRRYTEWVLGVDEETYVFGGAYPREDEGSATNPENLVIERHEGTGRFIVSDKSETELASESRNQTVFFLLLALLGIPWGIVGTLRIAGVL